MKEAAAKERNLERKVMTYRNNNKRVIKLAQLGLIEEIKPDVHTVNIHGRKDYKVTMKGMEQLIPYILTHPEVNEFIHEYMEKTGLNKQKLGQILVNWIASALASTIGYLGPISHFGTVSSPMNISQIHQLQESIAGFHEKLLEKEAILTDLESKQVIKSKSKTDHNIKITTMDIRNRHSEYGEQLQERLEKDIPEIDHGELAEDLYRMEMKKSKSTRVNPIPTSNRSKSSASQKKKR